MIPNDNPVSQGVPGGTMKPLPERHDMAVLMDAACEEESARARRRVLNLLSRHPDLVSGNLEGVAKTLCTEAALALVCQRVSLWMVDGEVAKEKSFNGHVFPDMPTREFTRSDAPAFFAAIERRRILEPDRIHEFETISSGSLIAPILVEGHTWGFCSFEGSQREGGWISAAMDFSVVLTEMVGRCIEQSKARELQIRAERAERGIEGLAALLGDALCFEVVNGVLQFQGDPTNLFGSAPRGSLFDLEQLLANVNLEDRDLLERRFGDWHSAGSPGPLTARLRYGQTDGQEVQLECRLLRSNAPSGSRLWGMVRPA